MNKLIVEARKLKQRLDDAKSYIGYGIKEGYYEPEQFEGMTNRELIEFAEYEAGRAEAHYEAYKDEYENT
jgi:hypothetical protein